MRLLAVALTIFAVACSPVSNDVNHLNFECGPTEGNDSQIIQLFNSEGGIKSPEGISVRTPAGADMSHYLTSKGCLAVPSTFDQRLIIERPSANEGLVFRPYAGWLAGIQPLTLKTWRYKTVTSSCKDTLATHAPSLKWPVDYQAQDASAFENRLEISDGKGMAFQESRVGVDGLSDEALDISKLADGSYDMTVRVKQLFSQDKIESTFHCELIIDRKAALVTMDREVIRLEGSDIPFIKSGPGESIGVQTLASRSPDQIYACLLPWGKPADQCIYQPVVGNSVTAPNSGIWTLKLFARDAAGNQGEEVERQLQIHDSNLVAANEALVDQAALAKHSGAYMTSLIASVRAYEKMRTLGSPSEYKAVVQSVRKALAESVTLPIEEISRKHENTRMLGMMKYEGEEHLVQQTGGLVEILKTTGERRKELDLEKLVPGNPFFRAGAKLCQDSGIMVASRQTNVMVYKNGELVPTPELPLPSNVRTSVSISDDCRYFSYTIANDYDPATRQQYVYDRVEDKPYQFTRTDLWILRAWNTDGSQVLMRNFETNKYFTVLDLRDGSIRYLEDVLGLTAIKEVQQAGDGSWGVLTADNVLHILGRDLKEKSTLANISSVKASQVADEFVLAVFNSNIRLVGTNGATRSEFDASAGNFTYLAASKDYVVMLPVGSAVLQIVTRTGARYDEIYNRGDGFLEYWLSASGYLHVDSMLYSRLFKLGGSITKKYKPNYNQALGLQFTPDGKRLLLKEQLPLIKNGAHYVEHNLVSWDFEREQSQVYPVEGMASLDSQAPVMPGYGNFTRDLELYTENGKSYVAAIIRRGRVAIYDADNFNEPLRVMTLKYPWLDTRMENWLLDISVHPEHKIAAGAGQVGNIYLFDLEQGTILSNFNIGSSEGEYPTAVVFSRSGKQLYVASSTNNLYLFDIDPETKELKRSKKVEGAGKDLRANPTGTLLAAVGNNGFLNIYDEGLELAKQYNLVGSGYVVGQSVAFSPDGSKVYAGYYPGSWYEIDIKNGTRLKVDFSTSAAIGANMVVDPTGERLAFMNGSSVQIVELNVDRMYQEACTWLKPRLPYIPDLSKEERALCAK